MAVLLLLLLLLQVVLLEETLMLHLGRLLVAAAIEAGGAHALRRQGAAVSALPLLVPTPATHVSGSRLHNKRGLAGPPKHGLPPRLCRSRRGNKQQQQRQQQGRGQGQE